MLINVSEGEECRIALLEDGRLQELYMERTSAASHVGNIYKGRVTNVEPSIQAAFVDFGLGRNGFLHISDLMPSYFGRRGEDIQETVGRKMARRDRPPIQRCLRRGDEIIVQIIKEGTSTTKGPTLSTYLSIPGKMLVMMPGMGKMGVSKKIEDEQERRRLRQILDSLQPPKDVAFIIRTAGIGKTKAEIERDLKYLTRLWETLQKKEREPAPVELYTEGDLVTRTVRDLFSPDVERIVIDNKDVANRVKEVIKITSPRARNRVDLYENPVPLFHQANIEREIELMYSRHVPLPSGGSLVIDSTEAVVAIDVNSGKNRENNDAEMTAFKVDMEAADEIPRQLKLRDLGGVIICDFIDLRFERHRRQLEERLFENFKNDRAKTKVLRMSQFGIIEITRQRMRPSLKRSIYADCPHCAGAGLIKTPESLSLDVMRKLAIALNDQRVVRVELSVCPDIAFYLLNTKRAALTDLEAVTKKKILIRTDAKLALDQLNFELFDQRDGFVILEEIGMTFPAHPHTTQLGNRPPGHTAQGRGSSRGGRRDNRNDRNNRGRPLPTRPLQDDDDDRIEDRSEIISQEESLEYNTGDQARDPARRGLEPDLEREADPTDIPSILETQDGDEVADEFTDEETGRDEQQQNRAPRPNNGPNPGPNQNYDQGPREGGGRRRRRRGRRGRGGRGNNANFAGEPNGNVNPNAGPDSAGYPDDGYDNAAPADTNTGAAEDAYESDAPVDAESPAQPAAAGEPPVRSDGPGLGADQRPRRRRRRGGRRHRRRNAEGNFNDNRPGGEQAPAESSDEITGEPIIEASEFADESDEAPEQVGEDIRNEMDEDTEIATEDAITETAPPVEPEPEVKPKAKRASRAKAVKKVPKTAPKRIPPKRKTGEKSVGTESKSPPTEVALPADVVRTGSADKHLISDEPVIPQPLSRPRSYSDLDAIPDDYD
jgi:ribonuclease E